MVGFSLSFTVTENEQLAVLPDASVTTKVFVVEPTTKADPLAPPAVCPTVCPGQLSADVTVKFTTAEQSPASLLTVIFAGQLMVGFSLSLTVTLKEQVAVFPEASVTTKVFVVDPTGKVMPLAIPAV